MDLSTKRVVATGGAGFLGREVCRRLQEAGCRHIVVPRRAEYDLTRADDTARLYADSNPQVVLHLAAEVGGIGANRENPGRFFYSNMAMSLHLIEQARIHGLEKFVMVSTICAYPRDTPVPFREDDLWNGYPEETNAPYGIAKKAALVMLDAYHRQYGLRSAYVLPVNLFGPGDEFDPASSHVIPALIRKCLEAIERGDDEVVCWGSGTASREFLYVDDAAEGIVRAAERLDEPVPVNLGSGCEITIKALATQIAELTGFRGKLRWDTSQPDGQPRRCLDVSRARKLLGWEARTGFREGLIKTIDWYRQDRACKPSSSTATTR